MIRFDEQRLVGQDDTRKAVVVPISSWRQVMEALFELEVIRAYDEAKRLPSDPAHFGRTISEIEQGLAD